MDKQYNKENYCFNCGSELAGTGADPLTAETFYTCSNCNMDYTVTITDDYTIKIEIDTLDK
jgi:transcription elongation factor Elf1